MKMSMTEYDYLKSLKAVERIINRLVDDLDNAADEMEEDTLCEMIFHLEELESILEEGLNEITGDSILDEN